MKFPDILPAARERNASYDGAVWNNSILRHNDNPVANIIQRMIAVFRFAGRADNAIRADPRVLVDDRVLDPGVLSDADAGDAGGLVLQNRGFRLVVITPNQNGPGQLAAVVYDA